MLARVSCVFCRAREDDLVVDPHLSGTILADRSPLVYGHLLICSSIHASSVQELLPRQRAQLLLRVRLARQLAASMSGRPTIAVEHGRSPTCQDPSGATHAHVHVFPVGDFDRSALAGWDAISAAGEPGPGRYLAVYDDEAPVFFASERHILHAARSLGAMVATANAVPWRPMTAAPAVDIAHRTAVDAVRLLRGATRKTMPPTGLRNETTPARRRSPPTVLITGPTGSGKTTVGSALAAALGVPAIELGVMLRLACAAAPPQTDAQAASLLWSWHTSRRMDFAGATERGLAAALPRLDGAYHETALWTGVDAQRLSELARGDDAQEALATIAHEAASQTGAVIIGRVNADFAGRDVIRLQLDADAGERARRKRRQLRSIGLAPGAHDWFVPRPPGAHAPAYVADSLDTTSLSVTAMVRAALALSGIGNGVVRRTLGS
jgi:cytidylate kinase/diadenosine tetraphosphate (Ap4A) HIT family hydrolase